MTLDCCEAMREAQGPDGAHAGVSVIDVPVRGCSRVEVPEGTVAFYFECPGGTFGPPIVACPWCGNLVEGAKP